MHITLTIIHLPGIQNILTYSLSRHFSTMRLGAAWSVPPGDISAVGVFHRSLCSMWTSATSLFQKGLQCRFPGPIVSGHQSIQCPAMTPQLRTSKWLTAPAQPCFTWRHGIWIDVEELEKSCLAYIHAILSSNRNDSTRKCYKVTWKILKFWCDQQGISPLWAQILDILDCLLF